MGTARRVAVCLGHACVSLGAFAAILNLPVCDQTLIDSGIERAGQGCAIGSTLFERIQQPSTYGRANEPEPCASGTYAPWPLAGALGVFVHAVAGFTNKSLRSLVAGLLRCDYTASQMTYDLRRLRLHGLIERIPRTNTYTLTPDGLRVAISYSKVHGRILRPLLAADHPPATPEVRRAL